MNLGLQSKYVNEYGIQQRYLRRWLHKTFPRDKVGITERMSPINCGFVVFMLIQKQFAD